MALPPKVYQFLVSMFASVGSILYGYDLGVIAEAIHSDNFVMQFNPTPSQSGAVVSVFTGGAFFGAMFAGPAGDYIGRKKTIMLGALIFIVGGSLQTAAQSLDYLYAGRAIAGLGVGFLVMIIPLYQAELAHPSIRGAVTALQQFMLGIGALVATWASYGCYINFPATSDKQWRISLGVQIVPAVILAALIMFFPESPRWLIDHGKHEQGLRTLAKLHAHGNETDAWVVAEYDQIRETIAYEHENEAKSYLDLFRNKSSFRRLLLACAIQASVQMTGVSAIQYYSPVIFGQMGISKSLTFQYQGISSVLALIAQMVCIASIDKIGRRWAMIGAPPTAPLSWIVPAEIFDTRTRSKGVTPIAMEKIGWRFYILFVVCNFTNAVYFWATQPETKKRPLEEMNYLFTNAPWFVPTMDMKDFTTNDLQHRAEEVERKGSIMAHDEGRV
ncbi:hypothetical protein Q7P36_005090 [Cladosporium allicinum]